METNAVLNHHRAVLDREREFIIAHQKELVSQCSGFARVLEVISGIAAGKRPEDFTRQYVWPRIGAKLFDVINGVMSGKDVADRFDQALHIIGSIVVPMCDMSTTATTARAAAYINEYPGRCKDTERTFHDTLQQAKHGNYAGQSQVRVYHSAAGVPLVLQKETQYASGLALAPFTITDSEMHVNVEATGFAHVPAGTVVGLRSEQGNRSGNRKRKGCQYSTWTVDGPVALRPVRLSAWAYADPLDRAIFAVETTNMGSLDGYNLERGARLTGHSLGDFQNAAGNIMEFCGVATARD